MISTRQTRILPFLLAGLGMLAPFSITTYLPSFAEMQKVFEVTDVEMQLTLSLYFGAFAFMSLWQGAMADSFGRRPVVICGLLIYSLASLWGSAATAIEEVYICRVLQGASAGAGIVVGRAVIRDLYEGPAAQKLLSLVVMLFAVAPAIGPVVGGWLQVHLGWRSVFVALTVISGMLLAAVLYALPETLPREQRQPFSGMALLQGYRDVLSNGRFLCWGLGYTFLFAGYFIYVLSAHVFVMEHLGLEETDFLVLFGPATAGLMLGSYLSSHFAVRWTHSKTIVIGFAVLVSASLWNLAVGALHPQSFVWYLPYIFCYTLGMGLMQPTVTLMGLDAVPERRGMGASLQLFMQVTFNTVLSSAIAPLFWANALSLASGALLMLVLSIGFTATARVLHSRTPGGTPAA